MISLAIVGSRDFSDYPRLLVEIQDYLIVNNYTLEDIKCVVSGGAVGTDKLAERFTDDLDIPIIVYEAEWDKLGKKAGYVRNQLIINKSDCVLAFWNGLSRGTKHSIDLAKKYNKELKIIYI